jgi:hypothetical protein
MDSMPDLENVAISGKAEVTEITKLITFPIELLLEDMDSMPELENIPGSEESVIFILAPANSPQTTGLEKGIFDKDMAIFSDEETIELVVDIGKEALITFDAAMLVNVKEDIEGMQTELNNLGASHHMSPY